MSSRLCCWKLLALAYFCINPFLLLRSSIQPALKSLKMTACFLLLLSSPSGRNSWAETCTVAAKQSSLHYSCAHCTRVFGTGHHNSLPSCASLLLYGHSCAFRVLFGTLFLVFALCMHAISNLDLRVWLEIRYWALFFHSFPFHAYPVWSAFPMLCLLSLLGHDSRIYFHMCSTNTSFVFLSVADVLFQIMSRLTALPPLFSCQFSSPFALFQKSLIRCWSYWRNSP